MSSNPGRRFWTSAVGIVAVAAILIGINMLVDTRAANVQADLTQQKLYTLSDGTRTVLAGLKDPVTLRLFYSRALGAQVPAYGAYYDRVREMLSAYAAISNGKVKLEFYDPEPFSETEDRAIAYGLQAVPIDATGEQVFFGLVGTNLLDDERTIPFLQPDRERFLEFDLTHLVQDLSNTKRPVVGVLSPLPMQGDPRLQMRGQGGAPWISMQQLRQAFLVRNVAANAQTIDPDIQVLLLVHPMNLSEQTLYAIDQFVMRGGRLMVMVEPTSEAMAAQMSQTGAPPEGLPSDLHKLFDAWGIQYDPNKVVGDLTGAWRVRANPGDRMQAVDYVAWYNVRDGIARDDPATADLTQITVADPGYLAKKDGASIEFRPLLISSPQSGLIDAGSVRNFPDPVKMLGDFKPDDRQRVIAARVRGVLRSAFSGPPEAAKDMPRPADFPAHKAQTDGPANLVIVADTDMLMDRFWVRVQDFFGQQTEAPFSDNGAFVSNLVGTLAGGDALIGLRSRGGSLRPFEMVDNIQRAAESRFRQTEQTLQSHLDETQKKLASLRTGKDSASAGAVLTTEQQAAIDDLRHDITDTRGKLRNVQLELRRDIAGLETKLRLLNILLVPAILTIVAIVLGIARRRHRALARS